MNGGTVAEPSPTPTPPRNAGDSTPPPTRPTVPVPSDAFSALEAARFGKFVRTEKLGAGGMGEVWRAWDTALNRWVALKFLKAASADELARFRREAETSARLTHPHIAAVYEVGVAQDQPYIAMQFVRGRTLRQFRRADPRKLAHILRDAALALDYAHRQGVIHRDLKPENFMVLTEDGSLPAEPHVFVVDFGLARAAGGASDLSSPDIIRGTPSYMPPEQALGRPLDPRADVYSLGATLYELLTGKPPFRGKTAIETLRLVEEADLKPPRSIVSSVDPDLETIVLKCLERDPGSRYASAAGLADDLRRWLEGEAVLATRPSPARRLRVFARRRRVPVILAGCAILLAAASAVVLPQWSRDRRAAEEARRRLEEASLYLPLEKELDLLRMKCYRTDFRLDEPERTKYADLERRVVERMRGGTASPTGWHLIARCREALGLASAADSAYAEALKLDPGHARSLLGRGRLGIERALVERFSAGRGAGQIALALQDTEEAVAWIRRGADLAGSEARMDRDLAACYLELVRPDRPRRIEAGPFLQKWRGEPLVEVFLIVEGLSVGRPDGLAPLTEATRRMPSSVTAWIWKGCLQKDPVPAWSDFDRALEIDPRNARARAYRAMASHLLGRNREALADLDRALQDDPDCLPAIVNRGSVRIVLDDLDGAIADFDRAIRMNPRVATAYVNRGVARRKQGDLEGAMADLDSAIRLEPDHPEACFNRGNLRRANRDFDGALKDYERALRLDPALAQAHTGKGLVHLSRGDSEAALRDFGEAIRRNPDALEAYAARANLLRNRGDWAGALRDLDQAVRLAPASADLRFRRGAVKGGLQDYEGAEADYTEAIRLNPRFADVYGNRGALRRLRGNVDGARNDLRTALEVAPADWPHRRRIEEMLQGLER